ncbi:hypothetical protein [Streptomyces sp. MNU89]|uniref:hypothetical protein n=1 Tax=Streptomyces sp. MNU89 TaxID=2560025 RepID=UPI001E51204D|nr:hypothetical protein [Streptomyces sp. MNU89]MCC9738938.1 hypothetical protein [Streptomyces sp. MNU89]
MKEPGRGDEVLAGLNAPDKSVRIRPDSTTTTLMDTGHGPQNPTSVALRGKDVYVLSAACTTATDPRLLRARPSGRHRQDPSTKRYEYRSTHHE